MRGRHSGRQSANTGSAQKSRKVESQRGVKAKPPRGVNDKPYECEGCDKRFARRYNVTRHRCFRIVGEKPHKCKCGKQYTRIDELQRHWRLQRDADKARRVVSPVTPVEGLSDLSLTAGHSTAGLTVDDGESSAFIFSEDPGRSRPLSSRAPESSVASLAQSKDSDTLVVTNEDLPRPRKFVILSLSRNTLILTPRLLDSFGIFKVFPEIKPEETLISAFPFTSLELVDSRCSISRNLYLALSLCVSLHGHRRGRESASTEGERVAFQI
jgi:hypothetical protein